MSKDHDTHSENWTFLSNHSHVLLCLAHNSGMRMREIAAKVRITERAVQRIIADLTEAGYIDRIREGRCNTYHIHTEQHLRHPLEAHRSITDLIQLINEHPDSLVGSQAVTIQTSPVLNLRSGEKNEVK